MSAEKTHRILRELHRPPLDPETRDHRAELEAELLGRHEELYGATTEGGPRRSARHSGWHSSGWRWGGRLRLAVAALALVLATLGAGAIPIDHEVALGHEIVLHLPHLAHLPGTEATELPPLAELLKASERLAEAASVSVNVAQGADGTTLTLLLLGDHTAAGSPEDPAARLVDGLRELYPRLGAATVSSRELIGVFPRSLGEVLGRKLFAVELGADELADARRAILAALGDAVPEALEVETEEAGGRYAIRVRIDQEN